jgi:hypothetical protein
MSSLSTSLQVLGLIIAIGVSGSAYYMRDMSPSPIAKKSVVIERTTAPFLSLDESPLAILTKAEAYNPIGVYTADQVGKKELFELPNKEAFPQ